MAKISQIKVQDKVYDVNDATKAVSQVLSSENLNDIQTPGFYSAPGNNTTTNKPTGVDAFGLIVSHNATGAFYTQVLYSANTNPGLAYRRTCTSGTWTAWSQDKYTDTTYSNMTAATSTADGKAGLVPAPGKGKQGQYLRGDGTWATPTNTTYGMATTSTLGLVKIGSGINVSSGVISIGTATTSANGLMTKADKIKLSGLSNTPALAMGVAGYVPGTPSVSDTSNSNRYLSGGANGKGAWRALPSVTWDTSGLGKTFKNYKSGAAVPTGYGTAATAPTVNAITSTSGRYYGVENDSNNRLFVNVPWTDTVGVTGTSVSKIRVLSPTQYNNLTTKSNLELYFILE